MPADSPPPPDRGYNGAAIAPRGRRQLVLAVIALMLAGSFGTALLYNSIGRRPPGALPPSSPPASIDHQLPGAVPRSPTAEASITGLVVVDMNRVFSQYHKVKSAQARYRERITAPSPETKRETDQIIAREAELERIKTGGGAATNELRNLENEITQLRNARSKRLEEETARLRSRLVEEIMTVLNTHLRLADISLALDSSGSSINGASLLPHIGGAVDWTDALVANLNRDQPGEGTSIPFPAPRPVRVATADLKLALSRLPRTKKAQGEINRMRAAVTAELEAMKDKQARLRATASAAEVQAMEKELASLKSDLERELEIAAASLRDAIAINDAIAIKDLIPALTAIAQQPGYGLVIDKSGSSLSGARLTLVCDGLADLTAELIERMEGKR